MNTPLSDHLFSLRRQGRKGFAALIDPDQVDTARMLQLVELAAGCQLDFFFVGGSLVQDAYIHELVPLIKSHSSIPVVLFPASLHQVVPNADGILFLSLISGRNPDLLIGKHVEAAPMIRQSGLEVLPTGYMLIDCGRPTTASYVSHTLPIPYDKPGIAACTAMAGEMLGLRYIYMDGGSGAARPIEPSMIQAVRRSVDIPIIVGGGIRSAQQARAAWAAGADLVVIGNAIEQDPEGHLIKEVAEVQHSFVSIGENLRT